MDIIVTRIGINLYILSIIMTKLGEFFAKKAVSRAKVSRKTGLSETRLSLLANDESTVLKADELYLIALAVDVNPCELLEYVCGDLKLK